MFPLPYWILTTFPRAYYMYSLSVCTAEGNGWDWRRETRRSGILGRAVFLASRKTGSNRMRQSGVGWLAVAILTISGGVATAADLSTEEVEKAMQRAVAYLQREQGSDGNWRDFPLHAGGTTALCTLALLNAGVEADDPAIQKALNYLRHKVKLASTYVVSLQTMVFCKAEPTKDLTLIQRNVKWLEKNQIPEGGRKGSWSYPGSSGDNSNAQFAVLGLYEAEQAGVKVSNHTWRLAKAYWERCQNPDGSWGYYEGQPGTGSMTCAGITSLVIASDRVQLPDAQVEGERIKCCQRAESANDRIQRALQWLGSERHFSVHHNPGVPNQMWILYYLYGLERVGRMTAQRFIGKHDWYREGTKALLDLRGTIAGGDGWKGVGHGERDPIIGTSFALLFLSKGRWPVLVAKLKHGRGDDWNQHRNDVANLTRYVESKWKRDMVWQNVDLVAATVEDLLQSPVLYLCGGDNPLPNDPDAQEQLARKLRDYLDRGGFLFAEGYSSGTTFDRGFRELMKKVLPEPEYSFHLLPPEHPIWRAEEAVDPAYLRPLLGIEFGCRTSVVYSPADTSDREMPSLSCLWELSRGGREIKYADAVQRQINAAMSIGINVMAYATNRELKFKPLIVPRVTDRRATDTIQRGKLSIAMLRHPGGCTAAPRALANLLESAANELKIRVSTEPADLDITDDALFNYHMAFMHGRNAFHLTDAERKQLGLFVERGGLLFANAICANRAFSESFRREMAAIFPKNRLEPIPADNPLFTTKYGGFDLSFVARRDPQTAGSTKEPLRAMLRKSKPELEGIKFGDRWGVIFSAYDLSCALEKHDSLECQGYVREDAARIGLNVVLYSLQQ